jgi:DNA-binding CsgD family transcriptional regulator
MPRAVLVGRRRELAEFGALLAASKKGRGGLLLVAGEAGVGKTRLVEEVARRRRALLATGGAAHEPGPPYAPLVSALRDFLRAHPSGLADCVPLMPHLATLLPELGEPAADPDPLALQESLWAALRAIGEQHSVVVFLDDLHWADHSTLDLLALLGPRLSAQRCLVVGAYRSDEIPRGHPLRGLRRELRRAGQLRELLVEPLDPQATAMLAGEILGARVSPRLAALLHEHTQGNPFFIEELAAALVDGDRLIRRRDGLGLGPGGALPVPESVRDAVLIRVARLSPEARAALEVSAVAGTVVDLDLVAELGGEVGIDELLESAILHEIEPGSAAFRHDLAREALYADVPWTRRRTVHRLLAERLELRGAAPLFVAEHWLAAREFHRACPALARAAAQASAAYAYRDALATARRAIEVWPDGLDESGRLALVEEIGQCAQLVGEFPEAVAAWREVADRRHLAGDGAGAAEAERHLAVIYELQGQSELALTVRRGAARRFSSTGRHGDASAELVAAAAHLDSAGSLAAALDLVDDAVAEARLAGRRDLEARALGIEGTVRAKLGQLDAGLEVSRAGLTLALDEDVTASSAADVYQRVANVLENAGDYRGAWDTYQEAYTYCEARGADGAAQVCLVCLAFILVHTGQWDRALELDRAILASPDSPVGVQMGAKQHFGLIHAARGHSGQARKLLAESGSYAERHERQRMEVWDALGQAWVDELEGDLEAAANRCRAMLARWHDSESLHYPVPALRWATSFLAQSSFEADARACAASLARLAAATVNPEAAAALAHALGETSLLDGDAAQASTHFDQALDVLRELELPYEAAQTRLRAGVAHGVAGSQETAVERLTGAYRTFRKLGAQPAADRAARELARLGEQVDRRLGRRAAARLEGPGLTSRELEIVRLVASGQTNREIARDLFLSTRTVDMHVRNVLRKLDCRSRAEATRKAGTLNLLQ